MKNATLAALLVSLLSLTTAQAAYVSEGEPMVIRRITPNTPAPKAGATAPSIRKAAPIVRQQAATSAPAPSVAPQRRIRR